ncbi:MAG TPA: GNAT family N-acetyltransferase [Acidimicrobiia bacterium]|nr:GNAT family N-acetyltransferase [Acidimicrobiia bacterium]
MRIRRARPDEIEVVLAVLADAAAWLRARGVEQWPDQFPTDWVTPAIEAGETWLAELDGRIIGSLVEQWDDPLFWAGYPSDAGYLHRLAVRRHGGGLGARLLLWAEDHAAGEGKTYLRLDCVASNESLRAYYERAGYDHVGDVTVGEFTQARYQKRIGA